MSPTMTGELFRLGKTKQSYELGNRVRSMRRQGREPNASRLDYSLDDFLPISLVWARRLILLY